MFITLAVVFSVLILIGVAKENNKREALQAQAYAQKKEERVQMFGEEPHYNYIYHYSVKFQLDNGEECFYKCDKELYDRLKEGEVHMISVEKIEEKLGNERWFDWKYELLE